MLSKALVLLAGVAASLAFPAPHHPLIKRHYYMSEEGIEHTVVHDLETRATVDFVTNSGICETTPGVNQYSGYLEVETGLHIFFWFFEARNDPANAPVSAWFNGGPGCSSMIGLFKANGPCQFYNGSNTPSSNPYSWNTYANLLYIDQPVGAGFSYSDNGAIPDIEGSVATAPYVWTFLQLFYKQFPQYASRDFGLFTESYGGHYIPVFANYIQSQNSQIDSGTITGQKINLVAIGINNGWYDLGIQYASNVEYAYSNPYKQIIDKPLYDNLTALMTDTCLPALENCTSISDPSMSQTCYDADAICSFYVIDPIYQKDFDVYDIRYPSHDPFPPNTYINYFNTRGLRAKIGAKVEFIECIDIIYENFLKFGDMARSTIPTLKDLVQGVHGDVQVLLWAGDSDFICNYVGNYIIAGMVAGFDTKDESGLKDYTVNGVKKGLYTTVGEKFSWLRVFEAGHAAMYYQPEVALQAFTQTLLKGKLVST